MNYLLLFLATLTSSGKAIICKRIGAGDNGPKRTFLLNSGIFLVASLPVLVIAILDGGFIASGFSVALAALFALTTVITQLTQIGAMKYGTAALTTLIYSAGFIIPTVWSHFAFGEIISPLQLVGIGVMLIALYMIINPGRSGRVSFLWLIFAILSMSGSGANAVLQKIHQRSALSGELYEFLFAALAFASVLCLVLGLTLKGDAGSKKELTDDISIKSKAENMQRHADDISIKSKVENMQWHAADISANGKVKKRGFTPRDLGFILFSGACIGALNVLNLTLAGKLPAVIHFPIYNLGSMILTGAAGALIYGERINKIQLIGFAIGCAAILIIGLF